MKSQKKIFKAKKKKKTVDDDVVTTDNVDDNSIAIDNTTNTITTTNSSVNGNNIIDIKDTIDYYNKLKANNFDSRNLIPVWYTSAINSVQDTINKVIEHSKIKFKEQYGDHNLTPIHFLRKDNFITDGEFDEAKYNEYFDGVMKSFVESGFEFINRYGNLKRIKDRIKNHLSIGSVGINYPIYFKDKDGREIVIPIFVVGPISDIINTKQTAIHELTHAMQHIYEYNKACEIYDKINCIKKPKYDNIRKKWKEAYEDLKIKKLDKSEFKTEEEIDSFFKRQMEKLEKKVVSIPLYIDELINQYIMESQADLCGDLFLVLEALRNGNKEEIEYLKTRLLCDTQADFFTGYDAFNPLLKEIEKIEQNPEKYKNQFMNEKGEIDYLKLFKYTYEVISKESEKYREFFNERFNILTDNYGDVNFQKNIREDLSNPVGKEFSDKKKYKAGNSHLCYDMPYKLNEFIYHEMAFFDLEKKARSIHRELVNLIKELNNSKQVNENVSDEDLFNILLKTNNKISKQDINTGISHS